MNDTTSIASNHTPGDHHDRSHRHGARDERSLFGAIVADIVRPVSPDTDPARRRLARARQIVAFAGAFAVLVQIIVWLMIAVLGGGLDAPWWLWTAMPAATAVAGLTVAERRTVVKHI